MENFEHSIIEMVRYLLQQHPQIAPKIGELVKQATENPTDQIEKIFTHIYETNGWSSPESVSGNGSTLSYTDNVRSGLPEIFDKFSITSIFDGPCGDFNWMKLVISGRDIRYTGGDIVMPLIASLNQQHQSDKVQFIHIDLTKQLFPQADLMICRDCLFHLSFADTKRLLENFVRSDIKFLLTTTMYNENNFPNSDIETGGFRGMDLFAAPYHFTRDVLFRIDDSHHSEPYTRRELCLWDRQQVMAALSQF